MSRMRTSVPRAGPRSTWPRNVDRRIEKTHTLAADRCPSWSSAMKARKHVSWHLPFDLLVR